MLGAAVALPCVADILLHQGGGVLEREGRGEILRDQLQVHAREQRLDGGDHQEVQLQGSTVDGLHHLPVHLHRIDHLARSTLPALLLATHHLLGTHACYLVVEWFQLLFRGVCCQVPLKSTSTTATTTNHRRKERVSERVSWEIFIACCEKSLLPL